MSRNPNLGARDSVGSVDPVDPVDSVLMSKTLISNIYNPSFKTGVSIRASLDTYHLFTLFVSIPYFGTPPSKSYSSNGIFKHNASKLTEYHEGYQPDWNRESLSLFEYRFRRSSRRKWKKGHGEPSKQRTGGGYGGENDDGGDNIDSGRKKDNDKVQDILVHQAWFIVLDNRSSPPLPSFFQNIPN